MNVGLGKDHTIFSLANGTVRFKKGGDGRQVVSVDVNHISVLLLNMGICLYLRNFIISKGGFLSRITGIFLVFSPKTGLFVFSLATTVRYGKKNGTSAKEVPLLIFTSPGDFDRIRKAPR